ncbi:hypothetical protein F5890DRAFT_1638437, partial [Lentinula detonsa]
LLGLTVTSPQGATWSVAPVLSGLTAAEGGFETGLGWFGVNWTLTDDNATFTLMTDTPSKTDGSVTLPSAGDISVDGEGTTANGTQLSLDGGSHQIGLYAPRCLLLYRNIVAILHAGLALQMTRNSHLYSPKALLLRTTTVRTTIQGAVNRGVSEGGSDNDNGGVSEDDGGQLNGGDDYIDEGDNFHDDGSGGDE